MHSAFLLVSCETDTAELFKTEIVKLPGVAYAIRVSGVYEFMLKIDSQDEEDLKKTIGTIRNNNWVRSSSTLVVVKKLLSRDNRD